MSSPSDIPDLESLVKRELKFFFTEEMRLAFAAARVPPTESVQVWQYGPESHRCWTIAADATDQIVYCPTGFGPNFPWSHQRQGETNLGTDGQWCAYLAEAFAAMWKGKLPADFILMGPGERKQ